MDECAGNKFMKMRNPVFPRGMERVWRGGVDTKAALLYLRLYISMIIPSKAELSPSEKHGRHPTDFLLCHLEDSQTQAHTRNIISSCFFFCPPEWKNERNFQWIWSMKFRTILKLKYDFARERLSTPGSSRLVRNH